MMERKRRQRSVFLLASSERSATGARRGTVLTIGKRYSVQPFDTSVAESATDNRPGGRVGAAHDAQAEAESRVPMRIAWRAGHDHRFARVRFVVNRRRVRAPTVREVGRRRLAAARRAFTAACEVRVKAERGFSNDHVQSMRLRVAAVHRGAVCTSPTWAAILPWVKARGQRLWAEDARDGRLLRSGIELDTASRHRSRNPVAQRCGDKG